MMPRPSRCPAPGSTQHLHLGSIRLPTMRWRILTSLLLTPAAVCAQLPTRPGLELQAVDS
jgi:hypothetical protein